VEVLDQQESASVPPERTAGRAKTRFFPLNVTHIAKIAAAAAVIFFVSIFFFRSPTAQAVSLERIYKILEQVRNICIKGFVPGEAEPVQEIWISRELNLRIFKTKTQHVLWNMSEKLRKTKSLDTGLVETVSLSDDAMAKIQASMISPWGLLPFNDISEVPPEAEWQLVSDENLEATITNTEVYDLTWIEKGIGSFPSVHKKWRGYIDVETKLPVRIEWWRRASQKGGYELESITEVSCPETLSVQLFMEKSGF
jgi:hypothetical protein